MRDRVWGEIEVRVTSISTWPRRRKKGAGSSQARRAPDLANLPHPLEAPSLALLRTDEPPPTYAHHTKSENLRLAQTRINS